MGQAQGKPPEILNKANNMKSAKSFIGVIANEVDPYTDVILDIYAAKTVFAERRNEYGDVIVVRFDDGTSAAVVDGVIINYK